MPRRIGGLLVALAATALGCSDSASTSSPTGPSAGTAAPSPTTSASAMAPKPATPPVTGGALAIAGKTLVVADEARSTLWSLPLPDITSAPPRRIDLPGRPAQVALAGDRVLVTVREPGLLLALDGATLEEQARVELPDDAWGLAITGDGKTAVVTSAWTHQVSGVALEAMKVKWTVNVPREPRAVVIAPDGARAYVSHAMGSALTRLDGIATDEAQVKPVALPPAPSRAPRGQTLDASFGLAATLSPTGDRLFVARQALGALGRVWRGSWVGAGSVDTLLLGDDTPLAPARAPRRVHRLDHDLPAGAFDHSVYVEHRFLDGEHGPLPFVEEVPFVQPAAIAYRRATKTLLVASQGTDSLVELDALALEPALHRLKLYPLGDGYGRESRVAKRGGAPSGLVLSSDESRAYVWCRSTFDVLDVPLVAVDRHAGEVVPKRVRVGIDPLLEDLKPGDPRRPFREAAALGRRLYHNALDEGVSGKMACNGCHLDGRDDGHVWLEVERIAHGERSALFVADAGQVDMNGKRKKDAPFLWGDIELHRSRARQTPMLAGRVDTKRRFGWRAESEDLVARITAGFQLHQWAGGWVETGDSEGRARALAAFVLKGLHPPRRAEAPLDAQQKRGKALFEDDTVGCAGCHVPSEGYSNGVAVPLKVPATQTGHFAESGFLTPPLRFVGGTPPYYHDGSAPTLEALVANNHDRMGKTDHLSAADRAALVAFLRTL